MVSASSVSRAAAAAVSVTTLDGVVVARSAFELNIVPHTARETTIADYRPGSRVNLEVDVIARYLERLLAGEAAAAARMKAVVVKSLRIGCTSWVRWLDVELDVPSLPTPDWLAD